jgi:hypothetical protein
VIEIDAVTLIGGKMAEVFIIRIVRQIGNVLFANFFPDGIGNGSFAGASATGDADDERRCAM